MRCDQSRRPGATSLTGYGGLGAPEGRFIARANSSDCVQLKAGARVDVLNLFDMNQMSGITRYSRLL